MAICEQGQEKLNHLRSAARTASTEQEAYDFVRESARIRYGLPVDSLEPEVSEALQRYHGTQWRAHKWSGEIVKVPEIQISGDHAKLLFRAVDLTYRNPNENELAGLQQNRSAEALDFNF